MRVTEAIREEHKHLFPQLEKIKQTAEMVGTVTADEAAAAVDSVINFLDHSLIPHAKAEDEAMYPVVAATMGAPMATATMSYDHKAVLRLTQRLRALQGDASDLVGLREVLYGLYALVGVHFEKEEEVYLPLLDENLSQEEADDMIAKMHTAGEHSQENHTQV